MMTTETRQVKSDAIAALINEIFEELIPTTETADDWAFLIPVRETEPLEDFEWELNPPTNTEPDDLPEEAYAAMAAEHGIEW